MPSDLGLKTLNTAHRAVLKVTGGRFGWELLKMPVIELTTTGRKTGQPRTVMLTSPYQEGSTYVVVASKGGEDTHPAWFLNVRDNPKVEVALRGGDKQPMEATVATAEERARIWPELTAAHKNYAGYQRKTDREIPLVLLKPIG
jgi:deazaflavin-dependent oxidoreductase (nitroreductase family)